jgi:hypothetical protein
VVSCPYYDQVNEMKWEGKDAARGKGQAVRGEEQGQGMKDMHSKARNLKNKRVKQPKRFVFL